MVHCFRNSILLLCWIFRTKVAANNCAFNSINKVSHNYSIFCFFFFVCCDIYWVIPFWPICFRCIIVNLCCSILFIFTCRIYGRHMKFKSCRIYQLRTRELNAVIEQIDEDGTDCYHPPPTAFRIIVAAEESSCLDLQIKNENWCLSENGRNKGRIFFSFHFQEVNEMWVAIKGWLFSSY